MPAKKAQSVKRKVESLKTVVKKQPAKAVVKAQPVKKAEKKLKALELEIFDAKGKVKETIQLSKEMFGAKINKPLLSQAVRVYLANQRMGTSSTKDRGEVAGSTKKIWQQKGTGRARHGSRKAPLFVGGGVAFGPKPRDYSLQISKKMKKLALFSALSSKLQDGEIKGIEGLGKITPKTKIVAGVLRSLGIYDKSRKVIVIVPTAKNEFENFYRATRNIEGVEILNANMLNAYEVLDNRFILLFKEAIPVMEKTFSLRQAQGK